MLRNITFILLLVYPLTICGQDLKDNIEGVETTFENEMIIEYDIFTGATSIAVVDSSQSVQAVQNGELITLPMFSGNLEDGSSSYSRALLFTYLGFNSYFDAETGNHEMLFLVDGNERFSLYGNLYSTERDSVTEMFVVELSNSEWEKISSASDVKFRLAGKVSEISTPTLYQMKRITNKVEELERDIEMENIGLGDNDGNSSPYQIQWESELARTPQVQPLPSNTINIEGTVTLRFEVYPDGTIGRVFPLRKMNPELEMEIMRTLRNWRFSQLPKGVPQEPQLGTITFRFVLD